MLEEKLRFLYALQNIDLQLDGLEEQKGDLPQTIANLREKENTLKSTIEELESEIKNSIIKSDEADVEILSLKEKIEKYKKQQYEVKNNKQYDALTREIENAETRIEQLQKEIDILEGHIKNKKADLGALKLELENVIQELSEKINELRKISEETKSEELKYRHQRDRLVVRLENSYLTEYERIRRAKNGKAIVGITRNACGGCYKSVPPQKLLEIRQNEKLYTCEFCGRILVSDEIVQTSSNVL